jgi:maltose alpha-D-glucosyltransferase/alpha-amylase
MNPGPSLLAPWLARQRWFAGKTRRIAGLEIEDRVRVDDAVLLVARVRLDDGTLDRYALPLAEAASPVDALDGGAYAVALYTLIGRAARVRGERGEIAGVPTRVFPADATVGTARRIGGEQSNTSVALGDTALLKHFRRLVPGPNPEQEITRFLTEQARFPHAPRLYGHVEYRTAGGESCTLAVAHDLVRDAVDGWSWVLLELSRALGAGDAATFLAAAEPTLAALEQLGGVTAALHLALASGSTAASVDRDFAPEPVGAADVARWSEGIRRQLDDARAALHGVALPDTPGVADGLRALLGTMKVRHHGDFHLGQTLYRPARGEWFVIDFEGEPLRPIAERRQKHAALRDVAGLLRSIDYAAVAAAPNPGDARTRAWERAAGSRYLAGYRRRVAAAPFVPAGDDAFARALAAFVVEKAAYEIVYEANHRPDWVRIPVEGLTRAASAITGRTSAGAA